MHICSTSRCCSGRIYPIPFNGILPPRQAIQYVWWSEGSFVLQCFDSMPGDWYLRQIRMLAQRRRKASRKLGFILKYECWCCSRKFYCFHVASRGNQNVVVNLVFDSDLDHSFSRSNGDSGSNTHFELSHVESLIQILKTMIHMHWISCRTNCYS